MTIARALIQTKQYDNEQIRRFLYFLKTFVHIENSEINSKFDKEINLLTGKESGMGIIETIQMLAKDEGREEEKVIIVKHLLRNSNFDVDKISFLTGVAKEFIEKVKIDLNKNR